MLKVVKSSEKVVKNGQSGATIKLKDY